MAKQRAAMLGILQSQLERLGVAAEIEVTTEGKPAAAIVRMADNLHADILVLASRGHSGLARLALGSVAEQAVRYAHCSVLVVRTQ